MRTVEILGETAVGCATTCRRAARQGVGRPLQARSRSGSRCRFLGARERDRHQAGAGHKAEFTEWRWVPLAEVTDLIVPFKREVYVKVVAAFSAYAAGTLTLWALLRRILIQLTT